MWPCLMFYLAIGMARTAWVLYQVGPGDAVRMSQKEAPPHMKESWGWIVFALLGAITMQVLFWPVPTSLLAWLDQKMRR